MSKLEIALIDFEADVFTLNMMGLLSLDMVLGAFEKFKKAIND